MAIFEHRRTVQSMKRFYNWFSGYYKNMEKNMGRMIDAIVKEHILVLPDAGSKTALEYACGTGLLTVNLARIFKSVEARDVSGGMLKKATQRIKDAGLNVRFSEGNLLDINKEPNSRDYVFISFALHLFSPEDIPVILKKLLSIARKAVVIIDHQKKWSPLTAFVEWIEGSYYDKFIRMDFSTVAKGIGAGRFEESETEDCSVMVFFK
jgi:ubiquinone/menaquinone biosynthesis C-methylase UbiE